MQRHMISHSSKIPEGASFSEDYDAETLVERLEANDKSCKVVDLSCRRLGPALLKRLGKALTRNTHCHTLDMRHCALWSFDVSLFASFLSMNSSVEMMDLSHNRITSEGAQFLATMLPVNQTLVSLNLSDNSISDGGMAYLLQAVLANASLEDLLVGFNPFTKSYITDDIHAKTKANARGRHSHHKNIETIGSTNTMGTSSRTTDVCLVNTIHTGRMFPKESSKMARTRRRRDRAGKLAMKMRSHGSSSDTRSTQPSMPVDGSQRTVVCGDSIVLVDETVSDCSFSVVSLSSTMSYMRANGGMGIGDRAADEWSAVDSEDWRSMADSSDDMVSVTFSGEEQEEQEDHVDDDWVEYEAESLSSSEQSTTTTNDFEVIDAVNIADRVTCA